MSEAPVEGGRRVALALEPTAIALLLAAVATQWAHLPDWRLELGRFQALGLVAFAAYALAVARRRQWAALPRGGVFVVITALVLRVALLPVTPTLSDDVYRYAWEGRVLAQGLSPYAHAPADTALAALRDAEVYPLVNHRELSAIYPPFAEAGFALVAKVWYSLLGFKLWVILHDLVLVGVLAWWSARRGGSAWDAIVYAWNPLVVSEYAGSAHHDPTGIVWLVLALALAERRALFSAGSLVAAVMVKLVALPAWPFVARDWPRRVQVVGTLVLVAALAGYAWLTRGPASGLDAYAAYWRHNDALFGPLAALVGESRVRMVALVLIAALGVVLFVKRVASADAVRALLRAGLLLGPVVHPWYLGWVLALECGSPSWAWLALSCTVTLGYGTFAAPAEGRAYHPAGLVRLFEFGVPALIAIGFAITAWMRRRRVRTAA
ncbi:MAG: hypothetical protein K8R56_09165 [Candidatus Eisenbacteria bacterium]|nr:hypothetical protein [Candidatus Eisenbacteria bacterium]